MTGLNNLTLAHFVKHKDWSGSFSGWLVVYFACNWSPHNRHNHRKATRIRKGISVIPAEGDSLVGIALQESQRGKGSRRRELP